MFWVIWWCAIVLLIIATIVWAMGWHKPNSRGDHGQTTDSTAGDDVLGYRRLFGEDTPVKAVYMGYAAGISSIVSTVKAAVDAGFNLIVLSFYMGPSVGADPFSAAYYWNLLSDADKVSTMSYAHAAGAKVIVSAGGAGYNAYPANGAAAFGQGAAQFATNNHLDGVDFDFENFTTAFGTPISNLNKTDTIAWITLATSTARNSLGPQAIITHAPQSPYFNQEFSYGYRDFMLQTPTPEIDLLLIQFYNQGQAYTTYDKQFINNDTFHPGTAVAQLITTGIPASQIVVGKLTQPGDGDSVTWLDPTTMGQWFAQAATDSRTHNWKTGFSTWQWHANGDGSPSSQAFLVAVYP